MHMVWLSHLPRWVVELWPWARALLISDLVPLACSLCSCNIASYWDLWNKAFSQELKSNSNWHLCSREDLCCFVYTAFILTWEHITCIPQREERSRSSGCKNEKFSYWLTFCLVYQIVLFRGEFSLERTVQCWNHACANMLIRDAGGTGMDRPDLPSKALQSFGDSDTWPGLEKQRQDYLLTGQSALWRLGSGLSNCVAYWPTSDIFLFHNISYSGRTSGRISEFYYHVALQ